VATYDIDVAVVHQSIMPEMIQNDLLAKYAPEIGTYKMMSAANGRNALGFNVEGYVMPMFQSQVVLAYNPDMVKNPRTPSRSWWPGSRPTPEVRLQRRQGGHERHRLRHGWAYWKTGKYEQYTMGAYDKAAQAGWPAAIKE